MLFDRRFLRRRRRSLIVVAALFTALLTFVGVADATVLTPSSPAAPACGGCGGGGGEGGGGGDGSDRPPNPAAASPFTQTTLTNPTNATNAHQFDITGFIQTATANTTNAGCPSETNAKRFGGTAKINNVTVTIPCNLIVQLPANTLSWVDFVNGGPSLALGASAFPSFELHLVGNTVNGKRIAGLAFAAQQSINSGSGVIKGFDFANGIMFVDDGTATTPVQINDPKVSGTTSGRYSAGQSVDPRFSVDQSNPTIRAATGYPMCIPRVGSANVGGADALCPQQNRPKPVSGKCRDFTAANVTPLPAAGELSAPVAGQVYCSQYVMPTPPAAAVTPTSGPDSRQQAPFEVGDYVDYAGNLTHPASGADFISAHTIQANVGIYTQPGSKPNYVSIGEFRIGGNDPNSFPASVEVQSRFDLEAETTDVTTPVDIYLPDVDASTGAIHNRWISMYEMTGERQGLSPSGGITTQFTGANPVRAREQATKAPVGLLQDPPRGVRVATRNTCTPQLPNGTVNGSNGTIAAAVQAVDNCLDKPTAAGYGIAANGLSTGQYSSPTFDFLFPENVKPGDPITYNDLWHLGFLRFGENNSGANAKIPSVGPLSPSPW